MRQLAGGLSVGVSGRGQLTFPARRLTARPARPSARPAGVLAVDRQLSGALCDAVLAVVRRHHAGRGLVERQGRRLPHVRKHGLHGKRRGWRDDTDGTERLSKISR